MSEWQNIETAPQDREVLAAAESNWLREWAMWRFQYPLRSRFIDGKWCAKFDSGWAPYSPQPSHWQPLPPPPSLQPASEKPARDGETT